jgi:hypothetical protein
MLHFRVLTSMDHLGELCAFYGHVHDKAATLRGTLAVEASLLLS